MKRGLETTGVICSRTGCDELATRGEERYHRFCEKHYRFRSMKDKARKRKIVVPTWEELEQCYDENKEMICPYCHCQMTWRAEDNVRHQLTLQHKDGGGFEFICYSCNSIHGNSSMPNKADIFSIPDGYKWCNACKCALPVADFHGHKNNRQSCDSFCKKCSSIKHREFYVSHKDKLYFKPKKFKYLTKIVTIISRYGRMREDNNILQV